MENKGNWQSIIPLPPLPRIGLSDQGIAGICEAIWRSTIFSKGISIW